MKFTAYLLGALALAAASIATPVAAQGQGAEPTTLADLAFEVEAERPAAIPTEHFAARSAYRDFAMSPDGEHLLIRRMIDGEGDLLLIDADTQESLQRLEIGEGKEVEWLRWAGNDKIIFSLRLRGQSGRFRYDANRILVRNIRTDDAWMLEVPDNLNFGGALLHVANDGSFALVSVQRTIYSEPSVYRYELVPGAERERVVRNRRGVFSWYADDAGVVRLGIGARRDRMRIYYRASADEDFEVVDKFRYDDERGRYWNVSRIFAGSDQGYVLDEDEDGRVGVRLFDYSTGETVETFYQNPDHDVNEMWIDRDGSPLAAFYTDDRERIEWFDDEMKTMFERLRGALNLPELTVVSRSRNNERMLIWGGSEADPGALYIFTPAERRLDLLANYRPALDFSQLVRPRAVRYRARDGLMISAYLTLPRGMEPAGLPLIIMPHGGPFGIRDRLAYNDEVQLLANRGYAVLQPNFRGSGGYGKAFLEAGYGEVGRGMQDDIDDAMDWAVGEGLADRDRVCVVGGSYGGFAALWAVIRNPERYACAASWAGVTDWDKMLTYDRRYLGRVQALDLREREEGEDADLDDYSPVNFAEGLSRPVLIAHGTSDSRVPLEQYETFVGATRKSPVVPQTLLIEGAGHGFNKPEYEQQWYDTLIGFLMEHNPADPPPAPPEASAEATTHSVAD